MNNREIGPVEDEIGESPGLVVYGMCPIIQNLWDEYNCEDLFNHITNEILNFTCPVRIRVEKCGQEEAMSYCERNYVVPKKINWENVWPFALGISQIETNLYRRLLLGESQESILSSLSFDADLRAQIQTTQGVRS